ncbi:hypothetical protein ANN_14155 [Periplaneta americana]|uniref:Uncharacterized protein n=1 Tax=Periplaneta americana TaxID=6978 RepID=A0ABQ8SWR2_PERAM|nr:hypothetical protein ANN_14155 [Periplaneta americana]
MSTSKSIFHRTHHNWIRDPFNTDPPSHFTTAEEKQLIQITSGNTPSGRQHSLKWVECMEGKEISSVVHKGEGDCIPASSHECTLGECLVRRPVPHGPKLPIPNPPSQFEELVLPIEQTDDLAQP